MRGRRETRAIGRAIVAACTAAGLNEVFVFGSQAILATWDETRLPARTTLSVEADIAPLATTPHAVDIVGLVATKIEADFGEGSEWHAQHGWYIQGVERATALLPDGWEERLVDVVPLDSRLRGRCLSAYDVCAAKLARLEPKDAEFVDALIQAGMISPRRLRTFIDRIPDSEFERYDGARDRRAIRAWVIDRER